MLAHLASHATVTQGDEELKDGVSFGCFLKEKMCEGKPWCIKKHFFNQRWSNTAYGYNSAAKAVLRPQPSLSTTGKRVRNKEA